jgi:hypothetical protein
VGLTEYYVNQEGPYSNTFLTQVNNKFKQIYMQLVPIIISKTGNVFDVNSEYTTELFMSQLTNSIYRNDDEEPAGVQILFATTMLEVQLNPYTIWNALRDIGGMLSIMFFFAIFAGCRHTHQFQESLKKAFYRANAQHERALRGTDNEDFANMSIESTKSIKELEMIPVARRKEVEKKFLDYFSFGKYLELHQRVEYLENELDKKVIVRKRNTIVPVVRGEEGGLLMRFDSEAARSMTLKHPSRIDLTPMPVPEEDEEDEEDFKSCRKSKEQRESPGFE